MKWLKRNAALLTLFVAASLAALLYWTGRLHVDWDGKNHASDHENRERGEEHQEERSHIVGGKVLLGPDVVNAADIRTAPASKGSVASNLRATGEVQFAEGRVAHVTPRVPGVIRAVLKTLGDEVSAGTPLCTIESVELGEARAKFVSALSERTLAERNYERWKQLFEKGLKTQNEFWSSENTFTRAKLDLEAAMGKLKALGATLEEIAELEKGTVSSITNQYQVKSLIGGSVLERHATLGENVELKDQIFLVADLSELWVQAAVYIKDLANVRNGMTAVVHIQGFPDVAFKGAVRYVGQRVDEKTRTAPLWITIKNEDAQGSGGRHSLRPGMFVTVDLEISRKEDALVVPLSALQTVAGQTVVFVKSAETEHTVAHDHEKVKDEKAKDEKEKDEKDTEPGVGPPHAAAMPGLIAFERRTVEVGARDGEVAEVLKGLQAGELVVVANAYLLKSEFEKSQISEGHSH